MSTGAVMHEERVRRVVIRVDDEGRPQVDAENETIVLNRLRDEEILWISAETFRIDFNGDSPFYEDQFDSTFSHSGLVRRSVLSSRDRTYKYTIDINGRTLDPQVIIDP